MLKGSCLCGAVRHEIRGWLRGAMNCHCSMCRKAQGSAFRTRASVNAAEFRFVGGPEMIDYFESSPGNHRGFCKKCGSPILSKFDQYPEIYSLPLGALDDDSGVKPGFHVFVGSKAPWHDIADDLPQFENLPPA